VAAVGKNDGMISAVWQGLKYKICGYELAGTIYKKGHPYFDELVMEIGEYPVPSR